MLQLIRDEPLGLSLVRSSSGMTRNNSRTLGYIHTHTQKRKPAEEEAGAKALSPKVGAQYLPHMRRGWSTVLVVEALSRRLLLYSTLPSALRLALYENTAREGNNAYFDEQRRKKGTLEYPQSLFRGRTDGTHYEQTLECFYCYYVDPDDASRNHDHDDQHGAHCCDAAQDGSRQDRHDKQQQTR